MKLMHGSAGVGPALSQWVDAFNEIGVATFVVDSFGPRGVKSMVENQTLIPTAANLMDAFQALMAGTCEVLAKRYEEARAPIRTIKYANAHHAWDSMAQVSWAPNAITFTKPAATSA
jgi:dienelactone hydrolase